MAVAQSSWRVKPGCISISKFLLFSLNFSYLRNPILILMSRTCTRMEKSPQPLPPGWIAYRDPSTGDPYFHNASLNQTTWDRALGQRPAFVPYDVTF